MKTTKTDPVSGKIDLNTMFSKAIGHMLDQGVAPPRHRFSASKSREKTPRYYAKKRAKARKARKAARRQK